MKFTTTIPPRFFEEMYSLSPSFMDQLKDQYGYQGWFTFVDTFMKEVPTSLEKLDRTVDYIVSIGIGGSYMGIKALVDFTQQTDRWLFFGHSLDSKTVQTQLAKIKGKTIGLLIISKSGETLEVEIFYNLLKQYGKKANWVCVLSSHDNFVECIKNHINKPVISYLFDEQTGGRFSLLSTLGIVILHLLRQNWKEIFSSLQKMKQSFLDNLHEHPSFSRGLSRYFGQYYYGANIEILAYSNEKLYAFVKCIEQIIAESDGKSQNGFFTLPLFYPQDMHSIGQIIADGKKCITETFFVLEPPRLSTDHSPLTHLRLNQKKSLTLDDTLGIFLAGIQEDHKEKNIIIQEYRLKNDIQDLFQVLFSEMLAVSLECFLLGINPTNQPGVEGYKRAIKRRLESNCS